MSDGNDAYIKIQVKCRGCRRIVDEEEDRRCAEQVDFCDGSLSRRRPAGEGPGTAKDNRAKETSGRAPRTAVKGTRSAKKTSTSRCIAEPSGVPGGIEGITPGTAATGWCTGARRQGTPVSQRMPRTVPRTSGGLRGSPRTRRPALEQRITNARRRARTRAAPGAGNVAAAAVRRRAT
nr:uncharacterized protein LOC129384371 [Dermacentor andersoni]